MVLFLDVILLSLPLLLSHLRGTYQAVFVVVHVPTAFLSLAAKGEMGDGKYSSHAGKFVVNMYASKRLLT